MDTEDERERVSRTTTSRGMPASVHQLAVDYSEGHSALLDALRRSGEFEVRMVRLAAGDYLVNSEVLVERKTIRDLAASLVDGRLLPQVARLACLGPCTPRLPRRSARVRAHVSGISRHGRRRRDVRYAALESVAAGRPECVADGFGERRSGWCHTRR
jgi:hypothetical protein